jgi:hypothetical protein
MMAIAAGGDSAGQAVQVESGGCIRGRTYRD